VLNTSSLSVFYLLNVRGEPSRKRREKSLEDTLGRPSAQDLDKRFFELAVQLERWSEDTRKMVKSIAPSRNIGPSHLDLVPLRRVLGKWSVEIITVLHNQGLVGFAELRKGLKGISSRVLSQKLKEMQDNGFVNRTVLSSTPTRVRYGLSDKGRLLVGLGRPVVLLLLKENYT
jgi:DNA-binding HxlR family transcriptional regulator